MLFDYDTLMNLSNLNNNDSTMVDDKLGLQRGNMFENEYKPYKNYNPTKLIAKSEKDDLLLKLCETYFAIIDLNLYLNLNSNDKRTYGLLKKYISN